MTKLNKLWQFLEVRTDRTAVLPEWKQQLGDEFRFVETILSPLDDLAESYPNPDRYGLPLRIVMHSEENIVAVCDERPSVRLHLAYDDIVLFKLNTAKFSKNIAHCLNIRPSDMSFDARSSCIGYLSQKGEKEYPVYMLLCGNSASFTTELQHILLTENGPGILLTASKQFWSLPVMRLLENHKWSAVCLDEILESTGKTFYQTSVWKTAVDTFLQLIMPQKELKPQFEFKLSGSMWQVTYEGITKHVKNIKGCQYIHLLMQNIRKPLFVSEIISHVAGNMKLKATGNAGEILTDQSIEEYRKRYQDLQQSICQAEKTGADTGKLKDELMLLAEQVKSATGLGGRKRRGCDDVEKMRIAVCNNINRTIAEITKFNKELGMHLKNSISTGIFVIYYPDREINWELF